MIEDRSIAVIGLGYVGLPLAVALANHYRLTGYDINAGRVAELKSGKDRTREVETERLCGSPARFSADEDAIKDHDVFIVTVPTPVDAHNVPDLGAVRAASRLVGRVIKKGAIVVYESTVYPGVTEDVCGPEIEAESGLVCGKDFFLGYSPERINPGDKVHTVDKITKVLAGQTEEVTTILSEIYSKLTSGGVFVARDIKTAEAAKVIENAQRDINIAFVNEIAMIAHKLGIATRDVLEAAATKWNFLGFEPGLVGGHCIGVDPYYLAHRAQELGYDSEIILAGRRINDAMGGFIANQVADRLEEPDGAPILILGLTFKENVPDLRNSQVADIIETLAARGCQVDVHDPLADPLEAKRHYGIELLGDLKGARRYAAVIGAVPHDTYRGFSCTDLEALVMPDGLVADVRGLWQNLELAAGICRWEL